MRESEAGGQVRSDIWKRPFHEYAIHLVAGPIAEIKFCKRIKSIAKSAAGDLASLLDYEWCPNSDSDEIANLIYQLTVCDIRDVTRITHFADWDDLFSNYCDGGRYNEGFKTENLLAAVNEAKRILKTEAKAHAALVEALMERGVLSGPEVERIWDENRAVELP